MDRLNLITTGIDLVRSIGWVKALSLFFFLILACIQQARAVGDHDIHISLSELRFNEESQSFEVAIKIFIDDLELALKKEGATDLRIGTAKENELADESIISYLNKHFTIVVDGKKLNAQFIGKEITDDMLAVWCYVEYKRPSANPAKCILSNSILTEVYSDQRNIMDIHMSNSHKDYIILESARTTWTYNY